MASFQPVGVIAQVKDVNKFLSQIASMNKAITGIGLAAVGLGVGLAGANLALNAVGAVASTVVRSIDTVTDAMFELGKTSVTTAIDVEDAFAGVLKTTNDLGTNLFALTGIGEQVFQDLRNLAREIPFTVEELSDIAAVGGQFNVASKDLERFTRIMAEVGAATKLTTDEATVGLATLSTVFNRTGDELIESIDGTSSALIFLGNNFGISEDRILNGAKNIAGAVNLIGGSEADVLAFSTAMQRAGIQSEAGGTAISNALIKMNTAVIEGGDILQTFGEIMGVSAEEFIGAWEADPIAAFEAFVMGLDAEGERAAIVLDEVELATFRSLRTFLGLAGNANVLTDAIAGSNQAMEEMTARTREAEIRFSTVKSQIQILKNEFRDLAITVGLELVDAFGNILDIDISAFTNAISEEIPRSFDTIIKAISTNLSLVLERLSETLGLGELTPDRIQLIMADITASIVNVIVKIGELLESIQLIIKTFQDFGAAAGITSIIQEVALLFGQELTGEQIFDLITDINNLFDAFSRLGEAISSLAGTTEGGAAIDFFDILILLIRGAIQQINAVITAFTLFTQIQEIWILVRRDAIAFWDSIITVIANRVSFIKDIVVSRINAIPSQLAAIWISMRSTAISWWDSTLNAIGNRASILASSVISFIKSIPAQFVSVWASIRDSAIFWWDVIKIRIVERIRNIINSMYGLGQQIMNGVINGITSRLNALTGAITNTFWNAIAYAKQILGIASPSKVFIEIGENVIAGFSKGLMDATNVAENAMSGFVGRTVQATDSVLPSSVINNTGGNRTSTVHVNANYFKTQSPQQISDDLALVSVLG